MGKTPILGCSSIGRAVVFENSRWQFESSHEQFFTQNIYLQLKRKKERNKEKVAENDSFTRNELVPPSVQKHESLNLTNQNLM